MRHAGYKRAGERDGGARVRDLVARSTLVAGYAKTGDMGGAEAVVARMEKAGVAGDAWTFNALLDGDAKAKNMVEAEAVLRRMSEKGVDANVVAFSALLSGYVDGKRMRAAEGVLSRTQTAEVEANNWTYNHLMRGYRTNFVELVRIRDMMHAAGCAMDMYSCGYFMEALCRNWDSSPAHQRDLWSTFEEAQGAGCITHRSRTGP